MMTIAKSRLTQIKHELVSYDEATNTVVRLLEEVRTIADQIKGLSRRIRTDSKALQHIVAGGID